MIAAVLGLTAIGAATGFAVRSGRGGGAGPSAVMSTVMSTVLGALGALLLDAGNAGVLLTAAVFLTASMTMADSSRDRH